MVQFEWLRENEVILVRPDGAVGDEDFKLVGAQVDPVVADRGRLEGLLLDATGFAGWDDVKALLAHIRFVNAHVDKVVRIAVVGDQWWLRAAPSMEPFFGTPVRVFGADELDAAKAWLLESPPALSTITFLPESEGNLIAIRVAGRLRDADYEGFVDELERRAPKTGMLRLLVIMDEGFRGWTPKACFDDIALAFSSWSRRLEKLAVVSGPGLVHWCAAHFPTAIVPYQIKAFTLKDREAALDWLRS